MRRLSIDPGAKRVGLAHSESDTRIAWPLRTLVVTKAVALIDALVAVIDELSAEEVIVGLPLRLDGTDGEGARRSRELVAALERRTSARVVLWDERLTTVAAQRALRDAGVSARDQRPKIDQAAATLLLQSYLDSQPETAETTSWDAEPNPPDVPVNPGKRRRKGSWRER